MSANAALYLPGAHYRLTRGYSYRSASTEAHEMDRNLMFYYEHLQLYDSNQTPLRGSPSAETRTARGHARAACALERPAAPTTTQQEYESSFATTPSSAQQDEPEVRDEVDMEDDHEPSTSPADSVESLIDSPDSPDATDSPTTPMDEFVQSPLIPEDAPPDYHPSAERCHPPAYQRMPDSLLPNPTFCHPELAENLRRFLLFCLAIDYDLVSECPEKLREVDWLPFLRLARHWSWRDTRRRFLQGSDPVRPAFLGNPSRADSAMDDERALKVEQCIFACVVRPAQALNLPPDVAITMLRDFPSSITSTGEYVPYNHPYRLPTTTKTLATKLLLDREILFDTVSQRQHHGFRSALHEANERVWGKYFVSLRSPGDYQLTEFGRRRERLEGVVRGGGVSPGDLEWEVGVGVGVGQKTGRKRFKRWVRKLSST